MVKFKVGDKVKCIDFIGVNEIFNPDTVYTITNVDEEGFVQIQDASPWRLRPSRFELVETPVVNNSISGYICGQVTMTDVPPSKVGDILLALPPNSYSIDIKNEVIDITCRYCTHNQLIEIIDALKKVNVEIQ